MTPYLNFIMEHWLRILIHLYIAVACWFFIDTALGIVFMAPIIGYAYAAWSVDIEEEGFCLAVFVGDEFTEPFVNKLAEDCHNETGRDVKVIIVKLDQADDEADEELEVELED